MTYNFKFNIKYDLINKTSIENYISDKKQNLVISEALYNTVYNNNPENTYCKTNIKKYIFYSAVGKQTYTEFEIYLFQDNVLSYLLLKYVNDNYMKPFIKYDVKSFVSNGIFSNIESVYYEFNSVGNYTITCINKPIEKISNIISNTKGYDKIEI